MRWQDVLIEMARHLHNPAGGKGQVFSRTAAPLVAAPLASTTAAEQEQPQPEPAAQAASGAQVEGSAAALAAVTAQLAQLSANMVAMESRLVDRMQTLQGETNARFSKLEDAAAAAARP
eukprot:SAG22_NODE_581_length_8895_cov_2.587767_5_plen_119_part_00